MDEQSIIECARRVSEPLPINAEGMPQWSVPRVRERIEYLDERIESLVRRGKRDIQQRSVQLLEFDPEFPLSLRQRTSAQFAWRKRHVRAREQSFVEPCDGPALFQAIPSNLRPTFIEIERDRLNLNLWMLALRNERQSLMHWLRKRSALHGLLQSFGCKE